MNQLQAKTCAFNKNLSKSAKTANKPKFVYISIINRIPRCCFTIKGVWGYSNRPDVNRYKFGKDQTKTCLPSPNPSSSLKVKAVKTPEFPYMAIVTSMDKALTKCTHRTCDDQQDHTWWRWMYIINMSHKHIK